jgi:hypothetical protein
MAKILKIDKKNDNHTWKFKREGLLPIENDLKIIKLIITLQTVQNQRSRKNKSLQNMA